MNSASEHINSLALMAISYFIGCHILISSTSLHANRLFSRLGKQKTWPTLLVHESVLHWLGGLSSVWYILLSSHFIDSWIAMLMSYLQRNEGPLTNLTVDHLVVLGRLVLSLNDTALAFIGQDTLSASLGFIGYAAKDATDEEQRRLANLVKKHWR